MPRSHPENLNTRIPKVKRYFHIAGVPHESNDGPWVKFDDLLSDPKKCRWTYGAETWCWHTECGIIWDYDEELPDGFEYCPFCGEEIDT